MVGGTSFASAEVRSSAPAGPALSPAWSTDPGVAGSLVVGGSVDGGAVVVGTELGALVGGVVLGGDDGAVFGGGVCWVGGSLGEEVAGLSVVGVGVAATGGVCGGGSTPWASWTAASIASRVLPDGSLAA